MIMSKIKKILLFLLILLIVCTIVSSYYRFVIIQDYLVTYKVNCDPSSASCYIGCSDETCAEPYPYALVERPAQILSKLCPGGKPECLAANTCSPREQQCQTHLCDSGAGNDCFLSEI